MLASVANCASTSTQAETPLELKLISILTIGSRGDVQPYIPLAQKLSREGYQVRFLTESSNISFVESFGITGVSMGLDFSEEMKSHPLCRCAMADGNILNFFLFLKNFQSRTAPVINRMFLNEMKHHRPDLLICGTMSEYYTFYSTIILKIPYVQVKLQYLADNPERPMWGFPALPMGLSRQLVRCVIGQVYDSWRTVDSSMVKLGGHALKNALSRQSYFEMWQSPPHPVLVMMSPQYKEALYSTYAGDKIDLVGASFLHIDKEDEKQMKDFGGIEVQDQLAAFFAQARDESIKPVYMGWGSMTGKSPASMAVKAVQALQKARLRGVILGGYAGLSVQVLRSATKDQELIQYAERNVLFVEKVSHKSLFEQVSCTVHHGGIGTTNASLCAGAPTIVTPFFWDQFDSSHIVQQLRVGIGFPRSFEKISADELAAAILKVVTSSEINERAKMVGEKLSTDPNGADVVLSRIEDFWKKEVETGSYHSLIADCCTTSLQQIQNRSSPYDIFMRVVLVVAGLTAGLLYHGSLI